MKERLHKVLAHAGVASRRAAERLIRERRVRVNGALVAELGTQIDPAHDRVEVDGKLVPREATAHHYIALNKPVGVVSTAHDPEGRPTVVQAVLSPGATPRVYPVGRLDIDSEGLVLLTDDGELTFRLTHARFGVEKEYHALVRCPEPDLEPLRRGIHLEDGPAHALQARVLRTTPGGTWVKIILREGRQRQVRRMLAAIDCPVERLLRVRIGPLLVGEMPLGTHRDLRPREIAALRECVGLDA